MNFIERLVFPPQIDHLLLAKVFLIVISLIFALFYSLLFGSSLLSVLFNVRGKNEKNSLFSRLARDLINAFSKNFFVGFLLGVFPIITLTISYAQVLYGTNIKIVQYFLYVLLHLVIGITFVYLYKHSLSKQESSFSVQVALGSFGVIFLLIGGYIFVSSTSLVFDPEKWPHIRSAFPLFFFSANAFARFVLYLTFSLAITGGGILFFFLNWEGGKKDMDDEYRQYVKKLGAALALIFTLFQPVFFLWNVVTIPFVSRSASIYVVAVLAMLSLMVLAALLYTHLTGGEVRHGTAVFVFLVVTVLMYHIFDHVVRENALREHTISLVQQAHAAESELEIVRQKLAPHREEAGLELGGKIFNSRCFACHRFDRKLVGPPYIEVLPKYRDNMDALVQFILNPTKKNPDFPPMPNQGLNPDEAKAVAEYIMTTFRNEYSQP